MKKTMLAASLAIAFGASASAQALSITVTTMKFYDATGATQFFGGGLNTSVVGSMNDTSTGVINSGTSPFFGTPWSAQQVAWFDTHSSPLTWAGGTVGIDQGPWNYNFHLSGNEVAAGMLFTWGTAVNIAVLQIFDCGPGAGACPGTQGASLNDQGAHATPGVEMANGPFTGQHATFHGTTTDVFPDSGTSEVPVPAAVWLFGSGLVGLAGVARRRKA